LLDAFDCGLSCRQATQHFGVSWEMRSPASGRRLAFAQDGRACCVDTQYAEAEEVGFIQLGTFNSSIRANRSIDGLTRSGEVQPEEIDKFRLWGPEMTSKLAEQSTEFSTL
jgi:hypothetical protein